MNKRILYGAVVVGLIVVGLVLAVVTYQANHAGYHAKPTKKDFEQFAARLGRTNVPAQSVLIPLDLSQSVRLAIGGLGLADDEQNRQLGDLVTANLTGMPGFALVERQSLDLILQELNLKLFGFARSRDAVRAGKLLKVDWFLLGTEAKINGKNFLVIRVVDARTGVIRDAGIFPRDKSSETLAADLALFMRQSRQNAAKAKPRVYLAVGAFEDLSFNNRQANFLPQLRAYLTSAYQGSSVTLLERESVEILLQEVRLDLAGLTEENGTNPPPPMQSAFWLLAGDYQSYETTNIQLELNLRIQRIFGSSKSFTLRGEPGESICRRIKVLVDKEMNQNADAITPTIISEVRAQMAIGKELVASGSSWPIEIILTMPENYRELDAQEAAKSRRNVEEAIWSFETVLLLDPGNREAKIYLAACFRKQVIDRMDEARTMYREILEAPVQDNWSRVAQAALLQTFDSQSGNLDERQRWFSSALEKNTNPAVAEFYKQNLKAAQTEIIMQRGEDPQARDLAEKRLFENIASTFNAMNGGLSTFYGDAGMSEFIQAYGTNRPTEGIARLVELYPKMKNDFPQIAPYLLGWAIDHQMDTNSPLIPELERTLDREIAHPDEVYKSKNMILHMDSAYSWCMKHRLYQIALKALDRDRLVNGKGDATPLDEQGRIALGYAYMGVERWQDALEIFECLSNRPVMMDRNGPWGEGLTPALPSRLAAACRKKLGLPALSNPQEFDLGKPLFCLYPSATFAVDDQGLWIGLNGRLMQLSFDLKTNLVIDLPMDRATRISTICVSPSSVWVATLGDGLIEFDKQSQKYHRFTIEEGLMMSGISSLNLTEDSLWIGYGHEYRLDATSAEQSGDGGLGRLDLSSKQFVSFTPSIAEGTDARKMTEGNRVLESTDKPTNRGIRALAADAKGNVWFTTTSHPLRRYRSVENDWKGFPEVRSCTCLTTDAEHVYAGIFGPPKISILSVKSGQWQNLKAANNFLPGAVTAITLGEKTLWVGGVGYIANLDPAQDKLLHIAYVKTSTVDRIQIGGGYVWAQFGYQLYRAPLASLP